MTHPQLHLPQIHLAPDALVAFVDDELGSTAGDRATNHLLECAECRAAVAAQRSVKDALGSAATGEPPRELLDRLRQIPAVAGPQAGPVRRSAPSRDHSGRLRARVRRTAALFRSVDAGRSRPAAGGGRVRRGLVGATAGVVVGMLAIALPAVSTQSRRAPAATTPSGTSASTAGVPAPVAPISAALVGAADRQHPAGAEKAAPPRTSPTAIRPAAVLVGAS